MTTLVNIAREVNANFAASDDLAKSYMKATALLPSLDDWDEAFKPFYELKPAVQLGACKPFGGVLFLIDDTGVSPPTEPRDKSGHSIALRMALYTCEILQDIMQRLPAKRISEILFFLCLTQQILQVQYLTGQPQLYENSCSHIARFETKLQELLLMVISHSPSHEKAPYYEDTVLGSLVKTMMEQSSHENTLGYYSALALSNLFNQVARINAGKFRCSEEWLKKQNLFVKEPRETLITLAILSGFKSHLHSSELVKWFCNHLLAVVHGSTGPLDKTETETVLRSMILLNGCLGVYHDKLPPQPARIAMSVKAILSWFESEDLSSVKCGLASESCTALAKLLPAIKSSAGEHWQMTLTRLCLRPWGVQTSTESTDANLLKTDIFVFSSSSLRMYSKLVELQEDQDTSDDLQEVFSSIQNDLNEGLLGLFTQARDEELPLMADFDEHLNQQILKIPIEAINLESIYPMLASLSPVVQATAFKVIEKGLRNITDEITMKFTVDNQGQSFFPTASHLVLTSRSC